MTPGPKLDKIDLNILAKLQQEGRITNVDLADAVGLSPSPCLTRVKRLEKAGYISAYGARVNLNSLGEFLTVFTEVTLGEHRQGDHSRFESRIAKINEIVECHVVSGGHDYLLKFVARGVSHYQAIIEDMLQNDYGIEKYFSYVVLKSPFIKHQFPIANLFGQGQE